MGSLEEAFDLLALRVERNGNVLSRSLGIINEYAALYRGLRRENPTSEVISLLASSALGRRTERDVQVCKEKLRIRTATPDLYVALESLGPELQFLQSLRFEDKPVILDAGGYVGTATLALRRYFPDSVIVCVEPSAENFQLLQRNLSGLDDVHLIYGALVGEGAPEEVFIHESDTGPWGFEVFDSPGEKVEAVPTVTMGQIMERCETDRISICKMDIEGSEEPLLRQADTWFEKVDALVIELHERKRPGIANLFEEASANRLNLPLPGEKILSLSKSYLSRQYGAL